MDRRRNGWLAIVALLMGAVALTGCVGPWDYSPYVHEIDVHDGSFRMDGKDLRGSGLDADASDHYLFTNVGTMNHTVIIYDDGVYHSNKEIAPGEQAELSGLHGSHAVYCRYHWEEGMGFHLDVVSVSD